MKKKTLNFLFASLIAEAYILLDFHDAEDFS
jgi:hypothetical protein